MSKRNAALWAATGLLALGALARGTPAHAQESGAAAATVPLPPAVVEGLVRSYAAAPCALSDLTLQETATKAPDHIQLAYSFRWQLADASAQGADRIYIDLNPETGEIYETELAENAAICLAAAPAEPAADRAEPNATVADWSRSPVAEADVLTALEGLADGTCAIADLVPAGLEPISDGWVRASYAFRWNVPETELWHDETVRLVVATDTGAVDEAELEHSYAICWDWR